MWGGGKTVGDELQDFFRFFYRQHKISPFLLFYWHYFILNYEVKTMEERYTRNIPTIQRWSSSCWPRKKVVILGCGGIGGYLVENLVRIGIGELTVVDGDVFQPSNLNRQSLAAAETLGWKKVRAAEAYAEAVNPNVKVRGIPNILTGQMPISWSPGRIW